MHARETALAREPKMKSRRWLWFVAAMGSLLVAAIGLQWWTASAHMKSTLEDKRLANLLPEKLGARGDARDEPIAASEEMKKAVGELLNFNDGLYRIYSLPDARVSVYVAWWEAGRMSPRLVAAHTPDVCWPGNGWLRDTAAEAGLSALGEKLRAKGFSDGELRVFLMQNKPEYVAFWHKVGDEMLSYGTGFAPPWWAWLDEMRRGGLNLRKEQLFVRISSDRPLQDILDKPELEPLRRALLNLGLRAKQKPEI